MRGKLLWAEWILFLLILCGAATHAFYYQGYTIDDSAISFRFAQNLASGFGLTFNRGMPPSEAYSNFLWTLMQTPTFWLGLDPLIVSKILGVLCTMLSMTAIFVMGQSLFSLRFLPLMAPLLMAANPTMAIWAIAGLEPAMFGAWLATGVACFYFAELNNKRSLYIASAVAFALLLLTRPDGLLFAGLMALVLSLLLYARGTKRELLLWLAIIATTVFVYQLWRFYYFGSLIPNTYLVKGGGGELSRKLGLLNFQKLLTANHNRPILYLAIASGLAYLAQAFFQERFGLLDRNRLQQRLTPAFVLILYLFAAVTSYCIYLAGIGWDYEVGAGRFFTHITPSVYFLAAFGIDLLFRGTPMSFLPRSGTPFLPSFLAAMVACGLTFLVGFLSLDLIKTGKIYYGGHRGVAVSIREVDRSAADYLREHSQPGQTVIGQDMGFITFFAPELNFIDSIGICDRTVASELYAAGYNYFTRYLMFQDPSSIHEIAAMDERIKNYLKSYQAEWILFFVSLPGNVGTKAEASMSSIKAGRYDHFFDPYLASNTYFHNLYQDPQIASGYVAVESWRWSPRAYYVLFKRLQQT